MNSRSKTMQSLSLKWTPMSKVRQDFTLIPEACGLYVFRLSECDFGRLAGRSDVLYIGSSKNLNQRIVKNYLKGYGGKTSKRIHRNLVERGYMERTDLGYVTSQSTVEEYRKLEQVLRDEYESEHHEFPPWNRAR